MKASIILSSRKLEGFRPPPIPLGPDGTPILPRKGEVVQIRNVILIVDEIAWHYDHDPEKVQVAVYLKDHPEAFA